MDSGHDRHVRFGEDIDKFPTNGNDIIVQRLSDSQLQIHLGFLKHKHTYEITVPLSIPEHVPCDFTWHLDTSLTNPYCAIKSYENSENRANLVVEFKAGKVKLMKETLRLVDTSHAGVHMDLTFLARVLGKGQGTPMLKDGIHSIAVEPDEESEASDWQGFE